MESAAVVGLEPVAARTRSAEREPLAEFIGTDDPRWIEFLSAVPHDPYHLPGYVDLIARYQGDRAMGWLGSVPGARCLIPLVERRLPKGTIGGEAWTDAASPLPHSGPVFVGDPRHWSKLVERFVECCKERRIVAVYLRNHPLFGPDWKEWPTCGPALWHGETVGMDLRPPEDEVWASIGSRRKRGIRKAEKEGFHVSIDEWSCYPRFKEIYDETMERHSASPFWRFSAAYFEDLHRTLGDHLHLCVVRAKNGDVASAGLFLEAGGTMEYHLGGTAEVYRHAAPSHLLYESMRRWARGRGIEQFHLGGGLPSLLEFKKGFSDGRGQNYSIRLSCDPEGYAELLRLNSIEAVLDGSAGFFPAYRGPE